MPKTKGTDVLARYVALRKKVDELRAECERAKGALQEKLRRLAEEFGCDNREDGEKFLHKLRSQEEKLEERLRRQTEAFEKKWEEVTNGDA